MMRVTALACAMCLAVTAAAKADDLALKDGRHWIAVASSKDQDQAIGIARLYGADARVVSSASGWFAVVLGPVKDASLSAFRDGWQGWPEIPADAVFSAGGKYTGTVWQPDTSLAPAVAITGEAGARQELAGLAVTASLTTSANGQSVHLAGSRDGKSLFQLSTPEDFYSETGNSLRLAPLDPATPAPEAIVTQFTGGAHCCVATWIAADDGSGLWRLASLPLRDGDGFWLEDVDGDGSYELVSVDNSFLYAFDSYAGSFAPVQVRQLRGGKLVDAPRDAHWRARIVQDLGGMEFQARLDPGAWKTNGFLAAWVAAKVELGQGAEAWKKMLRNYDHESDFGPQVCTTGESAEECPPGKLKPVPFPQGLAAFLKENGYTPVPGQ